MMADARGSQLTVPDEAVIATGERNVVITTDGNGQFGAAKVVTGGSQDGRTVILDGLQEGQAIVLSGQFLIDSEASLKTTLERLEQGP
jgi:Cu(I)/Ag(I) efflux system membrane fusion protein